MTAWNDNLLTNPHAVADKRRRVQQMFAAIAPSYDLNNRLHSLWQDQRWRRKAVKLANLKPTDQVVDVACGTGDLTIQFRNHLLNFKPLVERFPFVVGIDFTFQMLPLARRKGYVPPPVGTVDEQEVQSATVDFITWLNADAQ